MGGFIEPNIHPVLVHFAYALTVSSALAYLACRLLPAGGWRDSLKPAADWMLAIAAVAVIATIAAGFYAYYTVAHDAPSHEAMTTHRNWAVPSGLLVLALGSWRWFSREKAPGGLFAATMAAAAFLLSVTAWWGGSNSLRRLRGTVRFRYSDLHGLAQAGTHRAKVNVCIEVRGHV